MRILTLIRNIRCLGLKNGIAYWRIGGWAHKNPQILLDWAEQCEKEAENEENVNARWALRNLAIQLRRRYEYKDQWRRGFFS